MSPVNPPSNFLKLEGSKALDFNPFLKNSINYSISEAAYLANKNPGSST